MKRKMREEPWCAVENDVARDYGQAHTSPAHRYGSAPRPGQRSGYPASSGRPGTNTALLDLTVAIEPSFQTAGFPDVESCCGTPCNHTKRSRSSSRSVRSDEPCSDYAPSTHTDDGEEDLDEVIKEEYDGNQAAAYEPESDDDGVEPVASKARSKKRRANNTDARIMFDKAKCLDAVFDDHEFRKWAAKDTFVFLRQMRPDLVPWRYDEGIWSTNDKSSTGALFESCTYMQNDLKRANDPAMQDLVIKSAVSVYWHCEACDRAHKLKDIHRGVLTLLAVGFLGKAEWVGYFTGGES